MTTTKYFLTNFNLFAAFDDGGGDTYRCEMLLH